MSKKISVTEQKLKLRKILLRLEELKCLEYNPFDYQKEIHTSTESLVYARMANRIGKSHAACKELSFWFRGIHPYKNLKKRKKLTLWLVTETMSMAYEMYEKKLKEMIPEKEYRELKENSVFIGLEHLKTKSRIYFKAFAKGASRVQSATVDFMVIDEMPHDFEIFYELMLRRKGAFGIDGKIGQILMSFTPLKSVREIKDYVEGEDSEVKTIHATSYDCPLYTDEEVERERKILPVNVFKVRHLAEWANYEGSLVPSFNDDCIVKKENEFEIPSNWRVVMTVDPAASGFAGVVLMAEDPLTGTWYVFKELMVENIAPSKLIQACEEFAEGYNIINRYYDEHESWFSKEALVTDIKYIPVKKDTRESMTTELDTSFLNGVIRVFESCEGTIRQTTGYLNKKGTTEFSPIKGEFHLFDAVKYTNMVLKTIPTKEESTELKPLWKYVKRQFNGKRSKNKNIGSI